MEVCLCNRVWFSKKNNKIEVTVSDRWDNQDSFILDESNRQKLINLLKGEK